MQWFPYDLTGSGGPVPHNADLVVAALVVTMCRWTAASDIVVQVAGRSTRCAGAGQVARLHVDDHMMVGDFLRAVATARSAEATAGLAARGDQVDVVIASDHADLRSGEIGFGTDVPDAAYGFLADLAAGMSELTCLDGPLREVRCIAPERSRILDSLAGAQVPAVAIETMFLDQVSRRPEQVAVRDASLQLTYQQLVHAADQHAEALWQAGVRPGSTVLVATTRSVAEVVALLATIRLGAAYSGFDDDAPPARTRRILDKLAPAAAVVDAASADHPSLRGLTRVAAWRPGHDHGPSAGPPTRPPVPADPRRTAYIAFTSGSTGEPKGVVVPHRAVTRLALTAELQMHPGDRVLRMAPLAFDASTYEIWVTLLAGATLEIFPPGLPSVGRLARFFAEREISVAWIPASLFRLVATSRPKALAGLRQVVSGGEVVPHEATARVLELHPGLVVTNGYGPTENTTFTTTHTVGDSAEVDGPLPIGRPIAGTRVYVLDRNARPVAPGAVGELYAAGLGLADGYLDDECETGRRFGLFSPAVHERLYRTGDLVRLDRHGRLLFLGRVDDQIKLDGHRIETGEISAALARHPDVRDAVIVVAKRAGRSAQLVAAIATYPGCAAEPRTLRAYLSELLPSYMLPALWVVVDEIPLTRNGKVDAARLTESALSV